MILKKIRRVRSVMTTSMLVGALLMSPVVPIFAEGVDVAQEASTPVVEVSTPLVIEPEAEVISIAIEDKVSTDTSLSDSVTNTDEDILTSKDVEKESMLSGEENAQQSIHTTSIEDQRGETPFEIMGTTTPATTIIMNGHAGISVAVSSTTDDGIEILSGTAVAVANVLNLVNTNFVNSAGVVVFKNFFETLLDDFDLRDFYNSIVSSGCSVFSCSSDDVHTNISNDAAIETVISVEANSGGNTIDRTTHGIIHTGDAYAGVNLVNVANTNVIDSNYLLLTMNAFKNVDGDIVFPSLTDFFKTLGSGSSPASLSIQNTAEVVNNVILSGDSGNNSVTGNGEATITTGESHASGNMFNEINTSLVGGQSISILFRVHGAWAGEIFGAPDNLSWLEDGKGGVYLFDTGTGAVGGSGAMVSATNTGVVSNNVSVVALTGNNAVTESATALITTGNAYAGANIVNVVNATVVGRNWILAIINIFGDFNGDIAFGRPDLWVGGNVTVPKIIKNGSELTYAITVINNGDALASQVRLRDQFDTSHITVHNASVPYTIDSEGVLVWQLPDLAPGEAVEITYQGTVKDAAYNTEISNVISVVERETDNNVTDNTDIVSVSTTGRSSGSGSSVHISVSGSSRIASSLQDVHDAIRVERVTPALTYNRKTETSITEELKLRNTTNKTLRSIVLHDVLYDEEGTRITDEVWDLGDVLPHEEITLTYRQHFGSNARLGLYSIDTIVTSMGATSSVFLRNGTVLLWETEAVPFVLDRELISLVHEGEVLGASVESKIELALDENQDGETHFLPVAEASEVEEAPHVVAPASTFAQYSIWVLSIIALVSFLGYIYLRKRMSLR